MLLVEVFRWCRGQGREGDAGTMGEEKRTRRISRA